MVQRVKANPAGVVAGEFRQDDIKSWDRQDHDSGNV